LIAEFNPYRLNFSLLGQGCIISMNTTIDSNKKSNRLGTFGGVFTPSILTILGVIMFMRAGLVLGQSGILHALLILFLAKSITTLTALSISAVSTNTPVSGGGAYFLISRSLGPEFGGAIGIALFCAQAISVPFYTLGFTEALVRTFPDMAAHFRTIALATSLLLFLISWVGAGWAIKAQYVIMAFLALSIVAFLGGAAANFQLDLIKKNWPSVYASPGMSIWTMFAIYFPAVTGIMAGVNMSGDLKDPARSIPIGTLAAVGVGFLVYLIQIVLVGGAQTRLQLIDSSFETLCRQALFGSGSLVVAGVFAATLSSAIGSFLGAPRILQAVARDGLFQVLRPFAKGSPRSDEPHRALLLTLAVTGAVIFYASEDSGGGAFDVIAAVVTMFFLYTYGMINLAAFVESYAQNPSFRPRFRFYHWGSAGIGALACLGTALLIDAVAAFVAIVIVSLIYAALRRKTLKARFGDARWGFVYSRVRANLLKLSTMPSHPKNWRPIVLVLSGRPEDRLHMTALALWIGHERGLVTLARVLVGELDELARHREAAIYQLNKFLAENDFRALSTVVVSRSLDDGLNALIQAHPVGPLQPNTVMMGWSDEPERCEPFVGLLNSVNLLKKSLILVREGGLHKVKGQRKIDVWWRGKENGSLMMLVTHLLTLNPEWSDSSVRLLRRVHDEAGKHPATEALENLMDAARVSGEAAVIVSEDDFTEVLHRHSKDASLVLLGFNVPEISACQEFQRRFDLMLDGMPTTLLVHSSGEPDVMA
jgi:amino acid transporter